MTGNHDPLIDEAIKGLDEALENIRHRRLHPEEEIMAECCRQLITS
jgi:hypothetical protein